MFEKSRKLTIFFKIWSIFDNNCQYTVQRTYLPYGTAYLPTVRAVRTYLPLEDVSKNLTRAFPDVASFCGQMAACLRTDSYTLVTHMGFPRA